MNNGKICVSICAETADEFIEKIKCAEEIADVVEIRFDCWKKEEFNKTFQKISNLKFEKPILITFRPIEEGGKRHITEKVRSMFWEARNENSPNFGKFVDCEWDLLSALSYSGKFYDNIRNSQIICSFHHFQNKIKKFETVERILEEMSKLKNQPFFSFKRPSRKVDIFKIAILTNEITDSLAVWKLLEKAKSENKQLIPIAMGEAGKWTRILGLAFGSPLTYASLETGNETAPGQISAKDLIEVYRVKELDEQTEIYGIIGNPVSHSLSPYMHNAAFKHHGFNAVYIPFEVQNLDEFIKRMVRPETREIDWNLKGFSVTIPHKEAIIKHLDFIDEDAKKIGAVNTVHIVDGKLYGYNTDADGFIDPLRNSYGDLKGANVGIIGNGGAARACIYALKKEGANVTIFARNPERAKSLSEEFGVQSSEFRVGENDFRDFDILINASPLGMKDKLENETPAKAEQIKNLHMVYDLVYNPFETFFIKEAKSVGVPTIGGLAMLVAQGMKQFEIWTGCKAPMQIMSRAALKRLK